MKFRLVERLTEDNNIISNKLFNIKNHSNEAYELLGVVLIIDYLTLKIIYSLM